MDDATAVAWFRGKQKLNCAQAILKAFQPAFGTSDDEIEAFKTVGEGKAPGGVCGALHAVRHLLQNPALARKLEAAFEREAGSARCKKIRKLKKLACGECVALAARFLQNHAPPGRIWHSGTHTCCVSPVAGNGAVFGSCKLSH